MKTRHNDSKRGIKQSSPPKTANPLFSSLDRQLQEAMAFHQAGQLQDAERLYSQILQVQPLHLDALYLLGVMACQVGQFSVALDFTDRALAINPDVAELRSKRGDALNGLQRFAEAVTSFDRAILLKPNFAEAYSNRGNALTGMGQFAAGLESFEKAILMQPDFVEAHFNRGLAFHSLRRYSAAAESFKKAARLRPDFAAAYVNRGISLHMLQQYQAAVESLERALLLQPDFAEAHMNLGNALFELGQAQNAIASFDRAIQLRPDYAEAHNNRAIACSELQQYEAAFEGVNKALLFRPDFAQAHNTRANALLALRRYREALESCDTAIRIDPMYAEAHSNRGSALCRLQQPTAAIDSLDQAILLNPELAEAHNNRGILLMECHQYRTALESFDRAILLKPNVKWSQSMKLHAKRFMCDWTNDEEDRAKLEAAVGRGEKVVMPFTFLGMSDTPILHKKAAEICIGDQCPAGAGSTFERAPKGNRIRIGYYSADFYNHATSCLMAELFERHDRTRFEIFGFSFGPDAQDAMRERVAKGMDRFLDVREMTDREVAQLSRGLAIDIAVDLKGLTKDGRPGIFAERAADLQVNYLGYPGTMGAEFIDYLIGDKILIPERSRMSYTEKIVYLPDSYQVNDSTRAIAEESCIRSDEGLPEKGFVFCCFNINWKISPHTFDMWMRILKRVEGSSLWLLKDNAEVVGNLRREASSRGVDPERLVFAERLPPERHLARHRLADLFLDTFPCNAHTTASDALWAGLPLLTYAGESFASRVAASLLNAVGLPELIATTEAAYEKLAVELALDPERLRKLREKLERNRLTAPLFDTTRFVRHLEDAYVAMLERKEAGLPPDHLAIGHRI